MLANSRIYRNTAISIRLKGRCGVVVSRNVVVTQIRSDPGSIPGISTQIFVLPENKYSVVQSSLSETLIYNAFFLLPSAALYSCWILR